MKTLHEQILAFFLLLSLNVHAQDGKFSFTLSSPAKTSAGVFKDDSILIKTLWSDEQYNAGTHTKVWDGTDDYRNAIPSPDATYKIKLLSNNVQYTWKGTIGNTSDNQTGNTKYRGYSNFQGLAFGNTYGYFCNGYSEGFSSFGKFNKSTPNTKINLNEGQGLTGNVNHVATDGTNVYFSTHDSFREDSSFVFAIRTSDDTEVNFPAGSLDTILYGKPFSSVIGKVSTVTGNTITGLAVQKTGNYLFVARAGYGANNFRVLHKTTGALTQSYTLTGCKGLSVDNSNNVWVIQGTTITKFGVNSDGTLTGALVTITGLDEPLATQVSPDGIILAVIDAGTTQQVKFFNNSTGAATSTFGTAGGYFTDATVTNNKFYFSDLGSKNPTYQNFITYDSDGSLWINDPGNKRTQHYNSSLSYLNNVLFIGNSYSTWVDANNINRVFNSFMEFNVDYSVQTPTGMAGWNLSKNWGANVTTTYGDNHNTLKPVTLSNGRTYCLISKGAQKEVVELVAGGAMRFTGILFPNEFGNSSFLADDGSMQRSIDSSTYIVLYKRLPLTGFDGSNNPIMGNHW